MSILVVGVNHQTGPLSILERVAVTADALPDVVAGLTTCDSIREAVVLSTCNRTEVYAVAESFGRAFADIRNFFCERGGLSPDQLHPHLYSQHERGAVKHLFEVAAGLDSVVFGEAEILGQVRTAWELAQAEGTSKATLNLLFRHALETGKRVRTDTGISRSTSSVSRAAVDMALEHLGTLEQRRVLVVGAGQVGEGIAVALVAAGAGGIIVANRTDARADRLAERVGGHAIRFEDLGAALGKVDVLLTSTGAGTAVIDRDALAAARVATEDPLLVIDVALPRNVESSVGSLPGVTLLDLDDLRQRAAVGRAKRLSEAASARAIVDEEVDRFEIDAIARQAAPTVAQLHGFGERIRQSELERFASRLACRDAAQQQAVEALTRAIIAKLLHPPSVRLKAVAGTQAGERNAAALRDLFDLSV